MVEGAASAVLRLLGEPNRALSRGVRWRYGTRGSLSIDVGRGLWCDFETGEGGGLLKLVQRVRGGSLAEAARWLKAGDCAPRVRPRAARRLAPEPPRPCGDWARLWREAQPAEGSPVEAYLQRRGLCLPAGAREVLRYHPECPFRAERRPAMVALVRNAVTGQPQGVHRTPLTQAGERARGPDGAKLPKMVLGTAGGGVVMLSPDEAVETGLAVTEGIETGLAALRWQPWLPVWVALCAGGLARFPILPGIEFLRAYADNDAPGLEAARTLCQRYAEAGRHAQLIRPKAEGADLADLVQARPRKPHSGLPRAKSGHHLDAATRGRLR